MGVGVESKAPGNLIARRFGCCVGISELTIVQYPVLGLLSTGHWPLMIERGQLAAIPTTDSAGTAMLPRLIKLPSASIWKAVTVLEPPLNTYR